MAGNDRQLKKGGDGPETEEVRDDLVWLRSGLRLGTGECALICRTNTLLRDSRARLGGQSRAGEQAGEIGLWFGESAGCQVTITRASLVEKEERRGSTSNSIGRMKQGIGGDIKKQQRQARQNMRVRFK